MPSHKGRLAAAGPRGQVAFLQDDALHCVTNGYVTATVPVAKNIATKARFLEWSESTSVHNDSNSQSNKLFVATDDDILIFDIEDGVASAIITNASGNTGRLVSVAFGKDDNELLVLSDFSVKLTIWDLASNQGVEVRDAKFWSLQPGSGILAVCTRAEHKDKLVLLGSDRSNLLSSIIPDCHDVRGMCWSPDGMWLAVWDSPSMEILLEIFTTDGQRYRSWNGDGLVEHEAAGIAHVQWIAKSALILVTLTDGLIVVLETRFFSIVSKITLSKQLQGDNYQVYEEKRQLDGQNTYERVRGAFEPFLSPDSVGISMLAKSSSGSFVAFVSASLSTTVWIVDFSQSAFFAGVVVNHSAVKQLSWTHDGEDILAILCEQDLPQNNDVDARSGVRSTTQRTAHHVTIWSVSLSEPLIVPIEDYASPTLAKIGWLRNAERPTLLAKGDNEWIDVRLFHQIEQQDLGATPKPVDRDREQTAAPNTAATIRGFGPEAAFDESQSLDFSPVKIDTGLVNRTLGYGFQNRDDDDDVDPEDTFHGKKPKAGRRTEQ